MTDDVHELAALRFEAVAPPGNFPSKAVWMKHQTAQYIVERSVGVVMPSDDAAVTAMVEANPTVFLEMIEAMAKVAEHCRCTIEVMAQADARLRVALARCELKWSNGGTDYGDGEDPPPIAA